MFLQLSRAALFLLLCSIILISLRERTLGAGARLNEGQAHSHHSSDEVAHLIEHLEIWGNADLQAAGLEIALGAASGGALSINRMAAKAAINDMSRAGTAAGSTVCLDHSRANFFESALAALPRSLQVGGGRHASCNAEVILDSAPESGVIAVKGISSAQEAVFVARELGGCGNIADRWSCAEEIAALNNLTGVEDINAYVEVYAELSVPASMRRLEVRIKRDLFADKGLAVNIISNADMPTEVPSLTLPVPTHLIKRASDSDGRDGVHSSLLANSVIRQAGDVSPCAALNEKDDCAHINEKALEFIGADANQLAKINKTKKLFSVGLIDEDIDPWHRVFYTGKRAFDADIDCEDLNLLRVSQILGPNDAAGDPKQIVDLNCPSQNSEEESPTSYVNGGSSAPEEKPKAGEIWHETKGASSNPRWKENAPEHRKKAHATIIAGLLASSSPSDATIDAGLLPAARLGFGKIDDDKDDSAFVGELKRVRNRYQVAGASANPENLFQDDWDPLVWNISMEEFRSPKWNYLESQGQPPEVKCKDNDYAYKDASGRISSGLKERETGPVTARSVIVAAAGNSGRIVHCPAKCKVQPGCGLGLGNNNGSASEPSDISVAALANVSLGDPELGERRLVPLNCLDLYEVQDRFFADDPDQDMPRHLGCGRKLGWDYTPPNPGGSGGEEFSGEDSADVEEKTDWKKNKLQKYQETIQENSPRIYLPDELLISNIGPVFDVAAPGVLVGPGPGGAYMMGVGTSFAAPYVSLLAAKLYERAGETAFKGAYEEKFTNGSCKGNSESTDKLPKRPRKFDYTSDQIKERHYDQQSYRRLVKDRVLYTSDLDGDAYYEWLISEKFDDQSDADEQIWKTNLLSQFGVVNFSKALAPTTSLTKDHLCVRDGASGRAECFKPGEFEAVSMARGKIRRRGERKPQYPVLIFEDGRLTSMEALARAKKNSGVNYIPKSADGEQRAWEPFELSPVTTEGWLHGHFLIMLRDLRRIRWMGVDDDGANRFRLVFVDPMNEGRLTQVLGAKLIDPDDLNPGQQEFIKEKLGAWDADETEGEKQSDYWPIDGFPLLNDAGNHIKATLAFSQLGDFISSMDAGCEVSHVN